jgi:hypothetical protein
VLFRAKRFGVRVAPATALIYAMKAQRIETGIIFNDDTLGIPRDSRYRRNDLARLEERCTARPPSWIIEELKQFYEPIGWEILLPLVGERRHAC